MRVYQIEKSHIKKSFGICTLSVLYVILVSLIPIVGLGEKGSGTNTLLKAIIFVVFLISFLNLAKFRFAPKLQSIYILCSYLFAQFYNIVFTENPVSLIEVLIQTALFFALLFLLPAVTATKKDIINGIKIFTVFNFIEVVYNVILHFDRFFSLNFLTNVYYDMYSFFDNKNTYGIMLFVGLVLLFYWYYLCDTDDQKTRTRIRWLICLQVFAIAVSMCRTALLCTGVFFLCNFLKRFSRKKMLIAAGMLVLIIIAFCIPSVKEYILYVLFRIDVDANRETIIDVSLRIVRQNFLFGCGQEGWRAEFERISGNPYSHNGFLTVLMTGGLLYFTAYITMMFSGIKRAIQIRRKNFGLGSQALFCLIAMSVYAFFESIVLLESNATNYAFTVVVIVLPQLCCNMTDSISPASKIT